MSRGVIAAARVGKAECLGAFSHLGARTNITPLARVNIKASVAVEPLLSALTVCSLQCRSTRLLSNSELALPDRHG
jgi:hypothetical protein